MGEFSVVNVAFSVFLIGSFTFGLYILARRNKQGVTAVMLAADATAPDEEEDEEYDECPNPDCDAAIPPGRGDNFCYGCGYPLNTCPRCHTQLAEWEVDDEFIEYCPVCGIHLTETGGDVVSRPIPFPVAPQPHSETP